MTEIEELIQMFAKSLEREKRDYLHDMAFLMSYEHDKTVDEYLAEFERRLAEHE